VVALAALLYLNWQLTLFIILMLAAFGAAMAITFSRLRPIFRERGEITAEVTGRLNETLGGIRVVKAYGTEKREQRVFTSGAHQPVPQRGALHHRHLGRHRAGHGGDRAGGGGDDRWWAAGPSSAAT
jgi:ABC-type multidrug transport system fused ATPase/permease subunit